MSFSKKNMLVVLDGWGLFSNPAISAIEAAHTPAFNRIQREYPSATLITHGLSVGLPEGQMGNSEVGHLNIGAGRIVYQELTRIHLAIQDGSFRKNRVLNELIEHLKQNRKPLHLMGLVSDGGVHAHIDHLLELCNVFTAFPEIPVFIHAFTDGRDCDPHSGLRFIETLLEHIGKSVNIRLATVTGRYYAMDRDKRWERTQKAYRAFVHGDAGPASDIAEAIRKQYDEGISDEFLPPIKNARLADQSAGLIKSGDSVLFFNFRTDRPRQLVEVLTQRAIPNYDMQPLNLYMVTMTPYDSTFSNVKSMFEAGLLTNTLGEVLSAAGKTQLRAAETEKYPHVTYFFNGGREMPFPGESRILIPSPKVATYDLQPEMSAFPLTEAVEAHLLEFSPHFVCINYANADMVGHTGNFQAAVRAAEAVDHCLAALYKTARKLSYGILIIADHGNADVMINDDGSPNTAHSTSPVPVVWVPPAGSPAVTLNSGILADIAPTILHAMGMPKPNEMTGVSLMETH